MFIQTEETPNPNTLKFIPGCDVYVDEYNGFPNTYLKNDNLDSSPLAKTLLLQDCVEGVFLGKDFISISKDESSDWAVLKPHILGAIMEHFVNNKPVILVDGSKQEDVNIEDLDEVSKKIVEIINERVRPAVAQDGGDILFRSFEDGIVYLEMKGACSGCPSSTQTLKSGIENMLKFYVPEVKDVQQVA